MNNKAIRILFTAIVAGSLLAAFPAAQNGAPPAPPAKPAVKARPAPPTPPPPPAAAVPAPAPPVPPAPPAAAPAPVPPVHPVAAPVAPEEGPDWKTRVFKVRQADLNDIKRLLGVFRAHLLTDNDTGVLMVKASPQTLDAIAETLAVLDVPPPLRPDVELTVYLLEASEKPAAAAQEVAGLGETLEQVRAAFPYQGFRVLESVVLRGHTDEQMRANGVVPYGTVRDEDQPLHLEYQFSCEPRISSDLKGKVIMLDKVSLGVRVPVAVGRGGNPPRVVYQDRSSGFNTSVNLRENARVIVGKASMDGTRNALLLVITGRTVE